MIEYFPARNLAMQAYYETLQFHTKNIDVTTIGFAERIARHYTFLLSSKYLQHDNSKNGHWFTLCVYDSLIAQGINQSRIILNERANIKRKDDIDIKVIVSMPKGRSICWYLKTSLRERWKQVDRDAWIAKHEWGKGTTTVCLMYSEHQLSGFQADCVDPTAISQQLAEREQWAIGVDHYMALSQVERVNAFVQAMLEDIQDDDALTRNEC